MSDEKSLVTLPARESALDFYKTPNGLDPFIQQVRDKVQGVVYDMSTAKGRDDCRSDAAKVARSKTALEALGKQLSADAKALPKLIDAERARAWDELEALQAEVRQPLTKWEKDEEARVARHTGFIVGIKELANGNPEDAGERLGYLQAIVVDESLQEFQAEAEHALRASLESVGREHAAHQKAVADAQELAALRAQAAAAAAKEVADKAAREAEDKARQAADNARREAEQRAAQEREDLIRREAEAKTAAANAALELQLSKEREARQALEAQQRAEQAAKDAEAKAAREAEEAVVRERQRVANEEAEARRVQAEREADTEHRRAINRSIHRALVNAGVPHDYALIALRAIAQGSIPSVTITY